MRKAEKALRDAGWEQVARSDVEPGEEFYDIQMGRTCEASRITEGVPVQDYLVLRAPRPEPEYLPGTVVWAYHEPSGKHWALIRGLNENYPWQGANPYGNASCWSDDVVEVDHVIAYPDGTTPDREEPITLNRIRETGRVAVDKEGDKWLWHPPFGGRFEVQVSPTTWSKVADLADATAPGFFTGWADQEDGE